MKKVYGFDTKPLSTHMTVIEQIPAGSRVLEIGTASGYMGDYLIHEKQCVVWGVEPVEGLYEEAKRCGYEKMFNMSVEDFCATELGEQRFDRIILADVLEHTVHPDIILRSLRHLLAPQGTVVISLPNVAHYSIRRHLLLGRWNMSDAGILDRTHLRFFTLKTAREMIASGGLRIQRELPIVTRGKPFLQPLLARMPADSWYHLKNFLGYQFIFVAGA